MLEISGAHLRFSVRTATAVSRTRRSSLHLSDFVKHRCGFAWLSRSSAASSDIGHIPAAAFEIGIDLSLKEKWDQFVFEDPVSLPQQSAIDPRKSQCKLEHADAFLIPLHEPHGDLTGAFAH